VDFVWLTANRSFNCLWNSTKLAYFVRLLPSLFSLWYWWKISPQNNPFETVEKKFLLLIFTTNSFR